MDSAVLLQCLGLADKGNPTGNSNLGKLWFVFPPYISCIGRNFPFTVMVKVSVICFLSLKLEMGTQFKPFSVITVLPMETYFEIVWSRFSTDNERIWNFSTLLTISCKNVSFASFFAPEGILTFPVVPARLTKSMRWNKLLAQVHVRNCTWLSSCSACLSTKALATAMTTAVLTTPP